MDPVLPRWFSGQDSVIPLQRDPGSIAGWGTKILHAPRYSQKIHF